MAKVLGIAPARPYRAVGVVRQLGAWGQLGLEHPMTSERTRKQTIRAAVRPGVSYCEAQRQLAAVEHGLCSPRGTVVGVVAGALASADNAAVQLGAALALEGHPTLLVDTTCASIDHFQELERRAGQLEPWTTIWPSRADRATVAHLYRDELLKAGAGYFEQRPEAEFVTALQRARSAFDYVLVYDTDRLGQAGALEHADSSVIVADASGLPAAERARPRKLSPTAKVHAWLDRRYASRPADFPAGSGLSPALEAAGLAAWGTEWAPAAASWSPGRARAQVAHQPIPPTVAAAVLRDRHVRTAWIGGQALAGLILTELTYAGPVTPEYDQQVRQAMAEAGTPVLAVTGRAERYRTARTADRFVLGDEVIGDGEDNGWRDAARALHGVLTAADGG